MLEPDFRDILSAFNDAHVEYLVVGAFGAPSHLATPQHFLDPETVVQIGVEPLRVDILTSITGVEFDAAYATRLSAMVDGVSLSILGLDALIQNKRAVGRPKDLLDVEWLEATYRPG